jgi:uncharacterized protein YndB with AHSA1/START domain
MTAPMARDAGLEPIVKELTVPGPPEQAFDLFTRRMAEWWPLERFSVGEARAVTVDFPTRVGGDIVETIDDGTSAIWGTVTALEAPVYVAFTWHPGEPAAEATSVEVRFAEHDGATRVTLTHGGWSNRPDGASARSGYEPGWDAVLDPYRRLANAA